MNEYLYRIHPTRLAMLEEATPEESRIVGEHFTYLETLCRSGQVRMAGRTLHTDESSFGIVVFRAEDETAARRVVEQDPAVRDGVMTWELFPFRIALWANDV